MLAPLVGASVVWLLVTGLSCHAIGKGYGYLADGAKWATGGSDVMRIVKVIWPAVPRGGLVPERSIVVRSSDGDERIVPVGPSGQRVKLAEDETIIVTGGWAVEQ